HAAGAARARAGQSLPVPAREPGGSNLPALKVPSTTSAADDPGASVRERLLHAYTPPAVLVNRRYKVLYFHGDTSAYLNFPPGEPSYDLMSLVQRELASSIRATVRQALSRDKAVTIADVRFHRGEAAHKVAITAMPVDHQPHDEKLVLIAFESTGTAPAQDAVVQSAESEGTLVSR